MVDDVNQRVEDAFNTLVSYTEKTGNLRKDLKKDILQSVSSVTNEFSQMKILLYNVNEEARLLGKRLRNLLRKVQGEETIRQVAPSLDHVQQSSQSRIELD
jgi:hypothetical protein